MTHATKCFFITAGTDDGEREWDESLGQHEEPGALPERSDERCERHPGPS